MVWLDREKNRRSGRHSMIRAWRNKRVVAGSVILAIVMLSAITAPCFAAENDIS
jgi:hypothetical protein